MPLHTSKHAPRTLAEQKAISRAERTKQAKEKATRLLSRLHWKAESLTASYRRAMELRGQGSNPLMYPYVSGMSSSQAESMFKVDFFEFYTLLERFITDCLSIFGISISGMAPRSNVNALRFITNPDFARKRAEASHQFHANLLDALDDPHNPLHVALGQQDVRMQLGLAKDYRNKWKDAEEQPPAGDAKPVKIEDLRLDHMLHTILSGCVYAFTIVNNQPDSAAVAYAPSFTQGHDLYEDMEVEEAPWEYMGDAMDLD